MTAFIKSIFLYDYLKVHYIQVKLIAFKSLHLFKKNMSAKYTAKKHIKTQAMCVRIYCKANKKINKLKN